jgi:hypothetical protein
MSQLPEEPSRRSFLKQGATATAGILIVPRFVLGGKGYTAPSDQLRIAGVGVGGKGESDIAMFAKTGKVRITHLCDVDDRRAANSRKAFPQAKYVKDWRQLFDKEHKNFDAVSVSTPDHNHAITTLAAMQLGKHVYVQKPLTHDIYEARALTDAAKRYPKVVTQMGNQGASNDGVRQLMEWYDAGVIGDVHTIYAWTDRPVWPQGIAWPTTKQTPPAELDWDLWLGTAPQRDYVDKLVPFNWRGWWAACTWMSLSAVTSPTAAPRAATSRSPSRKPPKPRATSPCTGWTVAFSPSAPTSWGPTSCLATVATARSSLAPKAR